MFNLQTFLATLKQDNPNYERFVKSDLHDVVDVVSKRGFTAAELAERMKKVPSDKWAKYRKTRAYLIAEVQLLEKLLRARLVNFHTKALMALPGGNIRHDAYWQSDTGNLHDLAHVLVREKVSWGPASGQASPYLDRAYQFPGHHYGVGNAVTSPGTVGHMSDTHDAKGAWTPRIFEFQGPGSIEYRCSQVYQYSDDNRHTWHDIPDSTYEIVRTVSRVGDKIRIDILKRSVPPNHRHERRENRLLA